MSYDYAAHDFKLRDPWLYKQEHQKRPAEFIIKDFVDRTLLLDRHMRDMRNTSIPGGIPPKISKEKPEMGYNDYDNNRGRVLSSQEQIDAAVREAIEKPRREAEIAKRVAAVGVLESLKDAKVGTLITFTRQTGKKEPLTYAALKTADDRWFVTGDGYASNGEPRTFDNLLQWLTTGETLAENVQQATKFEAVSAPSA